MSSFAEDYISRTDLAQAYRKAKADTAVEKSLNVATAFAEYEAHLYSNLEKLFKRLSKPSPTWFTSKAFIGSHVFIPKKLSFPTAKQGQGSHFISSSPSVAWEEALRAGQPEAELRPIADFTVDMHVISSLWVNKVGQKFDGSLSRNSYGNRVRRYRATPEVGNQGTLQIDAIGTFKPYFSAYSNWRRNGMNAARKALKNGDEVVVVTMDLQAFYHSIDPKFILDPKFHRKAGVSFGRRKLTTDDIEFTSQLVNAFEIWAADVPGFDIDMPIGLPVGPASARVMANCILCEFDAQVETELVPIFYGRYVDDLFFVIKAFDSLTSPDAIVRHLIDRLPLLKKTNVGMEIHARYVGKSKLIFNATKLHTFHLTPIAGEDLLDTIERRIQDVSSEWRLLPDPDDLDRSPAAKVLAASRDPGDEADSFAKADHLSIRRLGFSIMLRNCDALARDLPAPEWQDSRHRFYSFAEAYVLSPLRLFEQYPYFSRLIGLAVGCGDYKHALRFVRQIRRSVSQLQTAVETVRGPNGRLLAARADPSSGVYKALPDDAWNGVRAYLAKALMEGVLRSSTGSPQRISELDVIFRAIDRISKIEWTPESVDILARLVRDCDLGRTPLKAWIECDLTDHSLDVPFDGRFHEGEKWRVDGVREFIARAERPPQVFVALLFPTRPHSPPEIAEAVPAATSDVPLWRRLTRSLRGSWVSDGLSDTDLIGSAIRIPNEHNRRRLRIALPSFMTDISNWSHAANGTAELTRARYRRLIKVVNAIITCEERPRYAVFPELSIPRKWIRPLAHTLLKEGISLIAGVEYSRSGSVVRNEAHLYLQNASLGYPSYFQISQLKDFPAHDERDNLRSMFAVTFPPVPAGISNKPIYQHGDFHFSVLICSELSNAHHRVAFRGIVDAVFVLCWNQDLESFEAMLDAAALDIHSFQVLVNNRLYGDSRVRAPFRERWRRDVVRIKGGLEDYVVVAELNIEELRRFQSHAEPPKDGSFKPTPEGFVIDPQRRVVPGTRG